MRKIVRILSGIAVLTTVAAVSGSCDRSLDEEMPAPAEPAVFTTKLYTGETRTAFDYAGRHVSWCSGDRLKILVGRNGEFVPDFVPDLASGGGYNGVAVVDEDGRKASMSVTIENLPGFEASDECRIYAVYPESAYEKIEDGLLYCNIAAVQYGSEYDYDAGAGVLFGRTYESVAGGLPQEALLEIKHVAAYCELTLTLPKVFEAGEQINYLRIEAANTILSGTVILDERGEFVRSGEQKNAIRIDGFSDTDNDGKATIMFACMPALLEKGETLSFELSTTSENGNYDMTVVLDSPIEFTAGHISAFELDMSGLKLPAGDEYTPEPAIAGKTGWYELPAKAAHSNLICYAHEHLPSDAGKRNYSFGFAPEHYAATWVAYPLHECYVGSADRTDKFGYDYDFASFTGDNVKTPVMQATVSGAYYTNFNDTKITDTNLQYSRGHQLPSADRTKSAEDNWTTFYSTNMTPQIQALNGGAWMGLESLVRKWMCADTLYIVTGAIFDEGHPYAYDNKSKGKKVSVPTRYYKVLLRTKSGSGGKRVCDCKASELQCIGFIFKHDNTRSSSTVLKSDAVSVSSLEEITGLQFFVNVPDAPKTDLNTSLWPGLK